MSAVPRFHPRNTWVRDESSTGSFQIANFSEDLEVCSSPCSTDVTLGYTHRGQRHETASAQMAMEISRRQCHGAFETVQKTRHVRRIRRTPVRLRRRAAQRRVSPGGKRASTNPLGRNPQISSSSVESAHQIRLGEKSYEQYNGL